MRGIYTESLFFSVIIYKKSNCSYNKDFDKHRKNVLLGLVLLELTLTLEDCYMVIYFKKTSFVLSITTQRTTMPPLKELLYSTCE